MKIAISGKGGVGKTLLASLLSKIFSESGYSVLAIDADPDSNLAASLGFPHAEEITPISEMKKLVEERTGARPGKRDIYFKLNPKVDDLPEKYCQKHNGIKLMVMGRVKRGGSGCYCPENVLLQALVNHLLLARNEVIILDMEAGIEHLGRGTAKAVDKLIIVVEPGRRSVETAQRVDKLAKEIGLNPESFPANQYPHYNFINHDIKTLKHILRKAYLKFYLRPSYIWQRIRGTTSIGDLKVGIKGLSMLLGNVRPVSRGRE